MSMLNVLANQHAAMMPDEYKHRSNDEMKQRVLEIKRAFGSKLLYRVIIIKRMRSSNLQMQQEIHCSWHK